MNRPTPGQRRHVRSCHQRLLETEAEPFDPEMSFMTIPDSLFVSGSSFFDQQGLDLNGRRRWGPGRVETAAASPMTWSAAWAGGCGGRHARWRGGAYPPCSEASGFLERTVLGVIPDRRQRVRRYAIKHSDWGTQCRQYGH